MAERQCATAGCTGTLPAGTGKHCPRCGGTEFIRSRKSKWPIVLLLIVMIGIIGNALHLRTKNSLPSTVSPHRRELMDAHDIASRMTAANARDDAYCSVVHRALAAEDYEYACEVANEMVIASTRDNCLMEVVEHAIKAHQTAWAGKAADGMIIGTNRDAALKRIMDAGGKSESARPHL